MRWWVIAALAFSCFGCTEAPSDDSPSGAVRLFLEAMARAEHDPAAVEEAYALLAEDSRRALSERAHLASSLGGRPLEPWDMIVRGRFRQSFIPARGGRGMRETIDGNAATVIAENEEGDRRAEVHLVLEEEGWRVILDLPPARERPRSEGAGSEAEGAEGPGSQGSGADGSERVARPR
ncbi:MAG: hypothetical protein SangKO_014410 [Sandaracinaceae bacterium]